MEGDLFLRDSRGAEAGSQNCWGGLCLVTGDSFDPSGVSMWVVAGQWVVTVTQGWTWVSRWVGKNKEYGRCYLLFISQCGVKWGASGAAGGEYVNFKVSYCRFIGLLTVAAAAAEVRRVRRWRCTATKCCRSCRGTACDFGVRNRRHRLCCTEDIVDVSSALWKLCDELHVVLQR